MQRRFLKFQKAAVLLYYVRNWCVTTHFTQVAVEIASESFTKGEWSVIVSYYHVCVASYM